MKTDILDSMLGEIEKQLFRLISEDTGRLLLLLQEARSQYLAGCWRQSRLDALNNLIEAVERYPDVINCLLALSNFIIEGSWESTSANTAIMHQLIHISNYKIDGSFEIQKEIFIRLKDLLCYHIDQHNDTYKKEQQVIWEKNQELALLRQIKSRELPNIILNDNPASASQSQINHPDKTILCLSQSKDFKWQLTWYDIKNRPNFLPISNSMQELLNELPDNKIPLPGFELHDKLKTCCDVQLGEESAIYLFDDSHDASEFAINYPDKYSICLKKSAGKWQAIWYNLQGKPVVLMDNELIKRLSTSDTEVLPTPDTEFYFGLKKDCMKAINLLLANKIHLRINKEPVPLSYVLTHLPGHINLAWYDSMGNAKPIDLADHPVLSAWLQSIDQLSDASVKKLKIWLMSVTTRRDIDEAKKRVTLNVLQKKFGITLIAANHFADIPPFKLQEGVYLLTKEPAVAEGTWTLYEREKNRRNSLKDLNGHEWNGVRRILAKYPNVLPNELDAAAKKSISDSIAALIKLRELDAVLVDSKAKSFVNQHEKIAKTLQQIHGIALLFADNFEQVPAFKRIPGTFLLSKQSGQWVLYQRQKQGLKLIDTSCEQWQPLQLLLAQYSAAELYSDGHTALKQDLRYMVQSTMNAIEQSLEDKSGGLLDEPMMKPEALDKQKFADVIKHIGGIKDVAGLASSSCEPIDEIEDKAPESFQQNKAAFAKLFKPAIVKVSVPPPPPPMPS